MKKISILKSVLDANQKQALKNRKFFDRNRTLVINIIASPGAGKTSVIENLIRKLKRSHRVLVIEGDIRGSADAARVRRLGIDAIQINTLTECHLDAARIGRVLPQIRRKYDLILVENVGNLVCPAEFEIGEDFKMAVLSTPEGDDKPAKYPLLFHLARVVLINKLDLLPHVDFNPVLARREIRKRNPQAQIYGVSARTGAGFGPFIEFIKNQIEKKRSPFHDGSQSA
jgi:hydrogenase nickel incorporation protein HypB